MRPFKKVKKGGRGRAAKSPKKAVLNYKEGEEVMARWPGSKLYYTARIQLVREEEGEYDVEYENGVIFTLTARDVYKQGGSAKKSPRKSKTNSSDSGDGNEDEDITTKLVKVSSSSKKISNGSFKEPAVISRASNGSRRVSTGSRSSRQEVGPAATTDVFSDDEELLSVSQRPSVSSVISEDRKISASSKLSKLNKVSFSSTINRLLDNVFVNKTNGVIEEIEEETEAEKMEGSEDVSKVSDGDQNSKDLSANSLRLDEFSEDELDESKNEKIAAASSVETKSSGGKLDWLLSLFFIFLSPLILITLHNICTANCKLNYFLFSKLNHLNVSVTGLSAPRMSLDPSDYFDKDAMIIVLSFMLVLRFCEFVCIGKTVQGQRMNGKREREWTLIFPLYILTKSHYRIPNLTDLPSLNTWSPCTRGLPLCYFLQIFPPDDLLYPHRLPPLSPLLLPLLQVRPQ